MFSVDNDQNPADALPCPKGERSNTVCGSALGNFLISAFGAVPDGFKTSPLVFTQCPDPGSPPGTLHDPRFDGGLRPRARRVGQNPVAGNHDHICADAQSHPL